ncbi:MAG: bacteriohemerythrin [Gammaproteobacteria bacterium]|nr:bacteriohemerythrin [Gammaproteobacteria bacterium]MBU1776958.1 bacteriohemerythrin [Gammaproteobacteria bacterium]MBU1969572.1 bacteriohemerythrin [Gammaproteobacteria bacterium]
MASFKINPRFLNPNVKPAIAIAGVVLVTLFAGNALFSSLRDEIRTDIQNNIAAVGILKASQIEYWLEDRLTDARIFGENSFFTREVKQWVRGGKRDDVMRGRLIERMGRYMSGNGFRSMVIYDAAGHVLLRAGDSVHEDEKLMASLKEAIASGRAQLVDLHRHDESSLQVRLGFSTPLRDNNDHVGAIYLEEDPEKYLYPLIHEWPTRTKAAETQLVRKEGDQILFLDRLRHRGDPPLTFLQPLDAPRLAAAVALRGERGVLEGTHDYRGKAVLSYAAAIPGTNWMLISKIDEEEAYQVIDKAQNIAVIVSLFVYLLIGSWFWQWRSRDQTATEAAVLKERVRADNLQMAGEKRFRTVFEHTALPMVRNALNGEFIEVNNAWCDMFGYSREETFSNHLSWQKVTHPEDMDPGSALVKKLLAGEIDVFKIEKRYIRKDGEVLWGILQVTLVRDETGAPEYFISAIQDITERKQLEKALEENLFILRMALEGANEAVWEWDLVTGKAKFSPQYYIMLGYMPDEFPATQDEWLARIHPEERDAVIGRIRDELAENHDIYITEYRMRSKDGRYRWIQGRGKCIAFDESGKPTRMVGINTDITERKQSEQQISFMAYHDKLTGLPNRALLFDRLAQAMSQAKRDRKYVALLFVDLDGFKAVNDEHGHEAGDTVLKMSAQRFLACVRAVDTVARFGGDEFAIILGNLDAPEQARGVAEKIVQAFAQSMALASGGECRVGASVGISIYPDHGSAMDNLMMAADRAMYESKRRGKNSFTFFNEGVAKENEPWIRFESAHTVGIEEMDEQHRNLVYLVNRLSDALKHGESKESTMLMLDELLVATTHHFETESRYMTLHRYPDQKAHEEEHARLVNEALQMKEQFMDGRELLAKQSLKDWLLGHILYSDKKLAAYLRKQGMT